MLFNINLAQSVDDFQLTKLYIVGTGLQWTDVSKYRPMWGAFIWAPLYSNTIEKQLGRH